MAFEILLSQKVQKATLIGVAFCIGQLASAETFVSEKSVEKARELLLQGNRQQALEMITDLIQEGSTTNNEESLLQEGRKLATFFVSESGQKQFELGESIGDTNPQMAEEKYEASLKTEGPNLRVLNSLSLLQLKQNECSQAEKWNQQALNVYSRLTETKAIELQIHACKNDFEAISNVLKKEANNKALLKLSVVAILSARVRIQNGEVEAGLETLRKVTESPNPYPDAWYWRWKLDPSEGHIQRSYLEKYITICKKMTPRLKRKYRQSAVVCNHLDEAETALKKSGASSDEAMDN